MPSGRTICINHRRHCPCNLVPACVSGRWPSSVVIRPRWQTSTCRSDTGGIVIGSSYSRPVFLFCEALQTCHARAPAGYVRCATSGDRCGTVPSSPPPSHDMTPQAHCHILEPLPHRKASRHLCSSSSPSSSSSAVKHSSDLFLSVSGLANFAPRNLDHSSRSWCCVTSRSPLRSLERLILRVCRLPESIDVSAWTLPDCCHNDQQPPYR